MTPESPCPRCKGHGTLFADAGPSGATVPCDWCGGNGWVEGVVQERVFDHAAHIADREARDAAALARIEAQFAALKAANARLREAGRIVGRIGEAA